MDVLSLVSGVCCIGISLCDEPIPRLEESYGLWSAKIALYIYSNYLEDVRLRKK